MTLIKEVLSNGRIRFCTRDNTPKGRTMFMIREDMVRAEQNRQARIIAYPDMRELTDESKKMLRRKVK